MSRRVSRRRFAEIATACAAGAVILKDPQSARAYAANEKLNIASIGVGGQGGGNTGAMAGENLVALCDVDEKRTAAAQGKFEKAKTFADFRKMFDEMQAGIDAVVVSTPDHTHAVAAVLAMKLGKHVYCEKPLTRTVYESRVMRQTAAKHKVVTQMGNQGSASEGLRRAVELAQGGAVGELRECHMWLQNGDGPHERPTGEPPVPAGLHWDLWLGPAPERPYHPRYLPGQWRKWRDFGSGGAGDMGCHSTNLAFRALKLAELWNPPAAGAGESKDAPATGPIIRIEAEASEINKETYPKWAKAVFHVPARGSLPALKLHWYNGGQKPPVEVLRGHPMTDWGCLVGGERGAVLSTCPWNTRFVLIPKAYFEGFEGPKRTLPRSPGHHAEWIRACKGGPAPFSSFDIGGPQNELVQLVNVACLAGKPIEYNPLTGKLINAPELEHLLHREYRKGWTL